MTDIGQKLGFFAGCLQCLITDMGEVIKQLLPLCNVLDHALDFQKPAMFIQDHPPFV